MDHSYLMCSMMEKVCACVHVCVVYNMYCVHVYCVLHMEMCCVCVVHVCVMQYLLYVVFIDVCHIINFYVFDINCIQCTVFTQFVSHIKLCFSAVLLFEGFYLCFCK